jgi:hypothetical protein
MDSFMFSAIPVMIMTMFGLIFVIFVVSIIKGITNTARNAQSPVITVEAKVIGKRMEVSTHHHNNADNLAMSHDTSSTTYFITFETEHGERLELSLSGRMYGLIIEGDIGRLTYQGTWFKDFQRM